MVICTADVCIQQTLPSVGDLYFDKAVNGFLKELFQRWREAGCNHEATLVFFWRVYHDKNAVGELGICASKEIKSLFLHHSCVHSAQIPCQKQLQAGPYSKAREESTMKTSTSKRL